MIKRPLSFATRLTLMLAALLLAYAGLIAVLGRSVAVAHEQESLQRLSHGLAQHIVGHWPEITAADPSLADAAARKALLEMLMVVNPGIQVYVLDADGRVAAYIGEPGMVRRPGVDLQPVRAFLAGAALPLRGDDPMGGTTPRIFSAAMFPPRAGQSKPPGYLYIVLDGGAREQVAGNVSLRRVWLGAALVAGVGALLTLLLGAVALRRLTRPLHRLAGSMRGYSLGREQTDPAEAPAAASGDEVQAIATAYAGMTARIEQQAARELQQASAHREMMASVAHDLRTPLTALHGHLEALAGGAGQSSAAPSGGAGQSSAAPSGSAGQSSAAPSGGAGQSSAAPSGGAGQLTTTGIAGPQHHRLLSAALSQSDKVRRLSQQLFELAALQSDHQVLHRERFNLDELVTDAVQKFELGQQPPPVTLAGTPPGRLELDGDLQLIERALSNLIDNALRHAPGGAPVRVSLRRDGASAHILIEDAGPGLPPELHARLGQQSSLRDPPIRRSGGGIGGLGLAIAQRVALLHGGSLLPLPAPQGGTRLCLALPLAA